MGIAETDRTFESHAGGIGFGEVDLVERPLFRHTILGIIGINALILGLETSPNVMAAAGSLLRALDERGNVRTLADVELDMIKFAIEQYGGQMSEVARRLGIGRSTLYRKLKEYGIDPDEGRADRMAS